jgi:prophage tail gpP-like protein
MGQEIVTVLADGKAWSAFRRVMVRASFRDAALSFHIDIAAEPGPVVTARVFKAGTAIDILSNGDLLCRGYVDRYRPRLDEHNRAEIAVSGRSRSQDFIDSSALHDTGNFQKKTLVEIGRAIHAGSDIATDQVLAKTDYQLTPGEGAFRALEKLARSQGVWLVGQPDGSILITVAGARRNGPLIEGVNCLSLEADHNWSGRHSKVIVRAQQPWGHGAAALEIEAEARDAEVKRNRPVVVIQDDDSDKSRAGKRARHRRDSEAGNSLKANIKTQGFRDDAGKLWKPGNLSFTQSPFLDIAQDMAIETVTFTQDRGKGSDSQISLCDPRALGGKAKARKGGSAGKAWGNDAGSDATP